MSVLHSCTANITHSVVSWLQKTYTFHNPAPHNPKVYQVILENVQNSAGPSKTKQFPNKPESISPSHIFGSVLSNFTVGQRKKPLSVDGSSVSVLLSCCQVACTSVEQSIYTLCRVNFYRCSHNCYRPFFSLQKNQLQLPLPISVRQGSMKTKMAPGGAGSTRCNKHGGQPYRKENIANSGIEV